MTLDIDTEASHPLFGQGVSLRLVMQLAGREGYPGHHAEHATKEALLVRERGLGEAMVTCRYTPEEAISEGLADIARGLVLGDQELGAVLHRLVRDLGLPMPAAALEFAAPRPYMVRG